MCDSRTSFQLIWGDGARDLDAITLGTYVSRDRQRRSRV
ncbi:IS481 family transposase, partial [Burkholderia sp. Bp8986]